MGTAKVADDRIKLTQLGENYEDTLIVEAWLKGRTPGQEASSLLCAKLMQRKQVRDEMVAELARKRGITFEEMWDRIVTGEAKQVTPKEYKQLRSQDEEGK